jgi:hypothetical protein
MAPASATGSAAWPMTPCMPCSFGLLRWSRSAACGQHQGPLQLTVSVRYIPLVTAAYGTWVARPTRTTTLAAGRQRLQLAWRVRPVPDHRRLVGESPEGSRQAGHQALNRSTPFWPRRRRVRCGLPEQERPYWLSRPVLLGWLRVDPVRMVVSIGTRPGCLAAADLGSTAGSDSVLGRPSRIRSDSGVCAPWVDEPSVGS